MAENDKPLEELDIIEARELRIGQEFHAFRFRKELEPFQSLDNMLQAQVRALAQELKSAQLEIAEDKLADAAQREAIEDNAIGNFLAGVKYALRVMGTLKK